MIYATAQTIDKRHNDWPGGCRERGRRRMCGGQSGEHIGTHVEVSLNFIKTLLVNKMP